MQVELAFTSGDDAFRCPVRFKGVVSKTKRKF